MANNPTLLTRPLAEDGQKNTIPDTTDGSTGLFSQQYGWQSINSLPLQAGGKAVKREDFNGAFNLLGGIAFMAQKGFTFNWSADQAYYVDCVVIDPTDGIAYRCKADVAAGQGAPSQNATNWEVYSPSGFPVGSVSSFLQSDAPDGWLSCNGAEVSRATYPQLWGFIENTSQVITEADWQSKNTAGDINIGWFSSGDGTTTFRLPRIVGSGELTEVKRFTTAGAGSFVAPVTGVYRITLQGAGGGGGASGVFANAMSGGGGGQGGHGEFYEKLTAGTPYSYIIGAGGAGGASQDGHGSDGGASSITVNANAYVANGGQGGFSGNTYVSRAGQGGTFTVNGTTMSKGSVGGAGTYVNTASNTAPMSGVGGGEGGASITAYTAVYGGGGAGGDYTNSAHHAGGNGGDGYIEFAYNPVPQYWYVRAFGSATNQGTIDITELANMLNAKLSIADVPKIAGFSGKQTFTSSGTFTPTITGNYKITLQGGGGGGGGAANTATGGGGGQGGHTEFYEKLTAGTLYSYVIGAGGSGGAAGANGNQGGTSSITINNNEYICVGGNGGDCVNDAAGGAGGYVKINGALVDRGASGTNGRSMFSAESAVSGVGGGASGGASYDAGDSGIAGGGGCGGGRFNSTNYAGGNGGDGYITFEWQTASLV